MSVKDQDEPLVGNSRLPPLLNETGQDEPSVGNSRLPPLFNVVVVIQLKLNIQLLSQSYYIYSIFRSSWGSERTWWIFQEKSRYIGTFSGKFIEILLAYDFRLEKCSLWSEWWVMKYLSVISWQEQVTFDFIWCFVLEKCLVGFYC